LVSSQKLEQIHECPGEIASDVNSVPAEQESQPTVLLITSSETNELTDRAALLYCFGSKVV
jgi:hypothetical protein